MIILKLQLTCVTCKMVQLNVGVNALCPVHFPFLPLSSKQLKLITREYLIVNVVFGAVVLLCFRCFIYFFI
jgi:hypothetical protein